MNRSRTNALLFVALVLAAFNLRLAINSISPILDTIQSGLGMGASVASLLVAIPVLCMGCFSPVAAKLSEKWGIETIICGSMILVGIGTLARFFTTATFPLLLTSAIVGIGIAAMGPLLSGFIKYHYSDRVPAMIAIYTMSLNIGSALASSLSAPIQAQFHTWQGALGIWGIAVVIGALTWIPVARAHRPHAHAEAAKTAKKLPLSNAQAWLLTLSFGFLAMLFYGITAWLPQIIQSMGFSKSYAGSVLTIFVIVQIPAGLMMRYLLSRFPSHWLWLSVSAASVLIGLLIIVLSAPPWFSAIFLGFGCGVSFSLNLLLPIEIAGNAQEASSWAAMTQSIGYVIGAAGPVLLGWIYDSTHSFTSATAGLIVMTIAMLLAQLFAVRNKPEGRLDVENG